MKFSYLLLSLMLCSQISAETLPLLNNGKAPQSFDTLWAQFDPLKEPLDTEIIKEWDEDGVIVKVLRYKIATYKGTKAMMAAVYGYPKNAKRLPGLVQIHGGGQYADARAVITNAKRGYATISIAWAGRISSSKYHVSPKEVRAYWSGKTNSPSYKITTEWGALDGYHAPSRNPKNSFSSTKPQDWTLDSVDSPRNNPWFLITMGTRRALTFLQQQPQVDAERLGVYGHSMGGKLTVMATGSDSRVKAAAPSCGGMSDLQGESELYQKMICDNNYLQRIKCPIIFLSPSNDFHGTIDDLQIALKTIQSKDWRVTCSPHHNHQDTDEYEVATLLWFDQHLQDKSQLPQTPKTKLSLKANDKVPSFFVRPDTSQKVLAVDVYYTQQGQIDGQKDNMTNTVNRFWHHAKATINKDGSWIAKLPIYSTAKPLWVYSNILYPLNKPVTSSGYYYRVFTSDKVKISSTMSMITPEELKEANIKATLKSSMVIEDFKKDWREEWFTYRPGQWIRNTHKVYHPQYEAPSGAKLLLELKSSEANKFVIGIDSYATEIQLEGSNQWQRFTLTTKDFIDAKGSFLVDWQNIKELRLGHIETLRDRKANKTKTLGAAWKGSPPEFRNLQWVK